MRRWSMVLAVLVVTGCESAEEAPLLAVSGEGAPEDAAAWGDTDGPAALRGPIFLERTGSMNLGGTVTYRVTGLNPNESTKIGVSTLGLGQGPCPAALGGQCLDLLSPHIMASLTADATGTARVNVVVSPSAPVGLQIFTQAAAARGAGGALSVVSNTRTDEVVSEITDDFVHFPGAADLLFVIDDSCSMSDEQTALTDGFGPMIDVVLDLGLDFHVGVVSTDMVDPNKSGKLQPDAAGGLWIDPSDSNPSRIFEEMATLGINGSATEEGLAAVEASLDTQVAHNNGFRRVTAQYAVIVLSDEEDQSAGGWRPYADRLALEAFNPGDVSFSSIVTPVGNCSTGSTVGNRYLNVTGELGGITESICAADYSAALIDLTDQLFTSVPYSLTHTPLDPALITVTVDEATGPVQLDPTAFVYDATANTVRLTAGTAPQAGSDLHVTYEPL
ncbi:MAG: hypothetical protein R3F59_14990 [Myxococcota bacterium]